jgi:hypothetical protein
VAVRTGRALVLLHIQYSQEARAVIATVNIPKPSTWIVRGTGQRPGTTKVRQLRMEPFPKENIGKSCPNGVLQGDKPHIVRKTDPDGTI